MFDGPRDGVFEAEGKEAMVFQEKTWSWRRIAVRLMLVPILAGGSAATAQMPSTSGPAGAPANQMRPLSGKPQASGDPKALLKDGRKALAEGRFNDARDLAQRAEASNPTGKWGLFDDTPNSLRQDIETAQAKAQKAESEQLTKKAKELFGKPAKDAEKAANIETALRMAKRADQLHGPYSVWEFGERPDKLVKEIEAARAKLRPMQPPPGGIATKNPTTPVASNAQASGTGARPVAGSATPSSQSMVATAAGNSAPRPLPSGAQPPSPGTAAQLGPIAPVAPGMPVAPATDPKKMAAQKLLDEGKQLANNGDFPGAKAKFQAAAQIGATFGDKEYTPGFALQELNTRGAAAISRLVTEAQTQMAQKEFAKADAALNAASEIAKTLSLFTRPIDEARANLQLASGSRAGGPVPVAGLAPAGGPDVLVPAPGMPGKPSAVVIMPISPEHTAPGGASGSPVGRQFLDQATAAYKAGDYEAAKKLAIQAHNSGGSQEEARGLLNQIDADVLANKQRTAVKSFQAAVAAADNKEHSHALQVLVLIDPNYLPADLRAKREVMLLSCKAEIDKATPVMPGATVVAAGGTQPPPDGGNLQSVPMMPPVGGAPAGTARVGGDPKTNPDSLTGQVESMRQVTFQKLRAEGLKAQSDAQAAWGRGEPDPAIQLLLDYENKVKAANLEPASMALLLRPIDTRLEMFQKMKRQADALARERNDKNEAKALIASRGAADEQRKAEVQKLVRQYHELAKKNDFAGAERVAMQAKQLDPDDAAVSAMALMAKLAKRKNEAQTLASDKEKMVYEGLNAAEREGPFVDTNDPVAIRIEASRRARGRGSLDDSYLRTKTPEEYQIDVRLDQPMSVEFNQTPLSEVIDIIREKTGLSFSYDTASITAAGISTAMPITEKIQTSISTRNILNLILEKAGLSFVIEYGVIKIMPVKMVKGRLFTKVFSVADLVTPIPNYAQPDYLNFDKMFSRNALNNPNVVIDKLNGTSSGGGRNGLGGGVLPGGQPGIAGDMKFGQGGSLQNVSDNPLAASATLANDRGTKHEQLIRLITSMVRPYSWDANGNGGPGKLEYFDLGSALVVNQTADVIREVSDLLEALRRLQDLAVAVEVRIISLSESWFERMGVDFSMNINTGGKNQLQFQPQLTTGQFTPQPFINSIQNKGVTVGLTPAGTFTPDLAVPIQSSSFQYAVPGFGGYPNSPGADGGVSLGLAFLNDIQVYLFMEAAQGDRRVNVMQAPKLTLFNGQTATLSVQESQFFVTSVQVYSVNGQIVFVPNNQQFISGQGVVPAINISLQAVVSADRRFVRINIPVQLGTQTGSTVPLFPVTTFIIPVFEGGSQGVPVPFTQFLQQPSFSTLSVQTTVVCPDGGTVMLGGLKTLGESRNEFGPPFLSDIPYLNRLFKNVGIGRETTHIMIMITPRIIISAEEEITQTENGGPLGTTPGR